MYIHKASTISFQSVFEKSNFHSGLIPLNEESTIQHPEYKKFIPPMTLRRMTDFVKMTIANGVVCAEGIDNKDVGGIIVGTGIGSSVHTGVFLDKVSQYDGGLVSPTSFILSTHNTAAGQLSLQLGCTGYNNTHVQNTLSFEHSLIDSMLCLEEGRNNIIVGSVDESDEMLFHTAEKLGSYRYPVTFGASFFLVDNAKSVDSIKIKDVDAIHNFECIQTSIQQFLLKNECQVEEIDEVVFASRNESNIGQLKEQFSDSSLYNYETYTGSYLTSSSFATHIAFDKLSNTPRMKKILVVNNLLAKNLGLVLLINEQ